MANDLAMEPNAREDGLGRSVVEGAEPAVGGAAPSTALQAVPLPRCAREE
jgi:hypothetical protein